MALLPGFTNPHEPCYHCCVRPTGLDSSLLRPCPVRFYRRAPPSSPSGLSPVHLWHVCGRFALEMQILLEMNLFQDDRCFWPAAACEVTKEEQSKHAKRQYDYLHVGLCVVKESFCDSEGFSTWQCCFSGFDVVWI